jgi:hypothetical protein
LLLSLGLLPLHFFIFLQDDFSPLFFVAILKIKLTYGLSERVPQTIIDVNLNLSICFKGDLLRAIKKLNRCRFRMMSYSPFTILIAKHLTEACMDTSFSGQPKCPCQRNTPGKYIFKFFLHLKRNKRKLILLLALLANFLLY